jgi:hypothetical protein
MSDLRQAHVEAAGTQEEFGAGWINTVAVYCGSRIGESDEYVMEAYKRVWWWKLWLDGCG